MSSCIPCVVFVHCSLELERRWRSSNTHVSFEFFVSCDLRPASNRNQPLACACVVVAFPYSLLVDLPRRRAIVVEVNSVASHLQVGWIEIHTYVAREWKWKRAFATCELW